MKKFLSLLLILTLALATCSQLVACEDVCQHRDLDDNSLCDKCNEAYTDGKDLPCQHRDENDDEKCDKCAESYTDGKDIPTCQHRDVDDNEMCDKCAEAYVDGKDIPVCQHRDVDDNEICDKCAEAYTDGVDIPVCQHRDANDNGRCDKCNLPYTDGKDVVTCNHSDKNDDNKCDYCAAPYSDGVENATNLIFQLTKYTAGNMVSNGCYRYLAGEDFMYNDNIDSMIADRNREAYNTTKTSVNYKYYDDVAEFGWGSCIELIFSTVTGNSQKGAPDMYANFVYDLMGASLKGCFANLKTTLKGDNYFEFNDEDYDESLDNRGYMWEYMKSTSLSDEKIYILASDYFIDVVRSFYIVPVHVGLLESEDWGMTLTGDLDGDGIFTINDFYEEVKLKKWTYNKVADYSRMVYVPAVGTGELLHDRLGFAVSQLGVAPNGLMFSTNISILQRSENSDGSIRYSYPDEAPSLYEFGNALGSLMNETGVIAVSNIETCGYGVSATSAIRNRFCQGQILFGDVILTGSLENDDYQILKGEEGFGVVPVPLYHEVELESEESYVTSIHNTAILGAIAYNTKNFSAATAFLNYQSTNSTRILNYYYDYKFQYDVADGAIGTVYMLQYIRGNVANAFDKNMDDAIGVFTNTTGERWSQILEMATDFQVNFQMEYGTRIGDKIKRLQYIIDVYPILPS